MGKPTKLKLDAEQANRLKVLLSGRGNRSRKGIYTDKRKYSIQRDEYDEIKRLHDNGLCKYRIMKELNTTYYMVNSTLNGKFDVIFNGAKTDQRPGR